MTGDNLQQDITWQDVLIAEDALMDALVQKRYDDPEHGEYWQERLAIEMLRRQEILILAKEQNTMNKREEQRSG